MKADKEREKLAEKEKSKKDENKEIKKEGKKDAKKEQAKSEKKLTPAKQEQIKEADPLDELLKAKAEREEVNMDAFMDSLTDAPPAK